jgi:hypothetical protein
MPPFVTTQPSAFLPITRQLFLLFRPTGHVLLAPPAPSPLLTIQTPVYPGKIALTGFMSLRNRLIHPSASVIHVEHRHSCLIKLISRPVLIGKLAHQEPTCQILQTPPRIVFVPPAQMRLTTNLLPIVDFAWSQRIAQMVGLFWMHILPLPTAHVKVVYFMRRFRTQQMPIFATPSGSNVLCCSILRFLKLLSVISSATGFQNSYGTLSTLPSTRTSTTASHLSTRATFVPSTMPRWSAFIVRLKINLSALSEPMHRPHPPPYGLVETSSGIPQLPRDP